MPKKLLPQPKERSRVINASTSRTAAFKHPDQFLCSLHRLCLPQLHLDQPALRVWIVLFWILWGFHLLNQFDVKPYEIYDKRLGGGRCMSGDVAEREFTENDWKCKQRVEELVGGCVREQSRGRAGGNLCTMPIWNWQYIPLLNAYELNYVLSDLISFIVAVVEGSCGIVT